MVRKNTVYNTGLFVWATIVFGASILVFSGNAAPYLTPSMLPISGPFSLFAFAAGLFVLGGVVVSRLRRRAWRQAGQQANLTPQGGGLIGSQDLVGKRNGRSVRARTIKRKSGGSSSEGSSKTTYTIVEADLEAEATDGLVIAVGDDAESTAVVDFTEKMETESVNDVETIGSSFDRANRILTQRAQDALSRPGRMGAVLAGDATGELLEALPDSDGMIAGKMADMMQNKIKEKLPGTPGTVTTQTKGLLLDGDEIDHQVAAVAAVADEFDATSSR